MASATGWPSRSPSCWQAIGDIPAGLKRRGMIHILLPVHNRASLTCAFVESLRQQTFSEFHLVLVDDGCTDGTAERVRALLPDGRLTVLTGTGTWWWAGSLERAYRHLSSLNPSHGDLVLITNDDVTIQPDFLQQAVAAHERAGGGLVLAQLWLTDREMAVESGVAADLHRLEFPIARKPGDINCLSTRGLVLNWGTMKAIGGFHPRLLPHYLSDYEYTLRAHRKGLPCITDPAFHLSAHPETTGYHEIDPALPVLPYLCRLFSTKSAQNPLHWSAFVALTCPPLRAVKHMARIWLSVLRITLGLARRQFFTAHG